ncbi:MAG: potassium transporter TrkH [Deltaproteobacteria bacterium]|nr:potassium transporter TrkH [Deltaproteobacteria bacterium]
MNSRANISRVGLEGALIALSPLPLLLPFLGEETRSPEMWRLTLASVGAISCLLCGLNLFHRLWLGKLFGNLAAVSSFLVAFPHIRTNPFATLSAFIALIFVAATLLDFRISTSGARSIHSERCLQRARYALFVVPFVVLIPQLMGSSNQNIAVLVIGASSIIAQAFVLHWSMAISSRLYSVLPTIGSFAIVISLCFFTSIKIAALVILITLLSLTAIPSHGAMLEREEHWWDFLINNPARVLITTFSSLCILGTLLLLIPGSTTKGNIDVIDAAFTSVSAVCVTGLIVKDTPVDFTLFGQLCILILIQLGGLGIMSITTVALHVLGTRLSLKQERLMTMMADTSHEDLVTSLQTIIKFTFAVEIIGASILTILFYTNGESFFLALWRGIFTAISAFCNAGFALQSDNLVSYQTKPLILHTVALLIILGGLAPATSLMIPKWLKGKPIPIPSRIALLTTVILLLIGTFSILAFEWKGVLVGLSATDKVQNAWFQSVTLRTAGFNSVDIATITSPTFLLMIALMFIGGSPGGTAGGVKTTTIGLLALTFVATIANRSQVVMQKRRIHANSIYRAVTVVASGMIVWLVVVIMLEVSQQIPARDLIFEATSALGTVGLSTGATTMLDEIGKLIIIFAMFAGRIGPVTMFMLVSDDQSVSDTRYPLEKVSLT